jgi:TPR repeat protein
MQLPQVQYFLALCGELNFTRAASRGRAVPPPACSAPNGLAIAFLAVLSCAVSSFGAACAEDSEKARAPGQSTDPFQTLQRLAESGDAGAELKLGMIYANGEGTPRNSPAAIAWFRRAAEQGRPEAQYQLGIDYEEGIGVAQDVWLAMHWLQRSTQSGYPDAQNAIGELYLGHQGISANYSEAIDWFRRAAESFNARAMYNLGMRFALGQGVRQHSVEAYKWFERSAQYSETGPGQDQANRAREAVRKTMTPLQVYGALRIVHAPKVRRYFDRQQLFRTISVE